jgi:hypothetical protein
MIGCAFAAGTTTPIYGANVPSLFNAGFPVSAIKISISSTDDNITAGNDSMNVLYIDNLLAGVFFSDTSISGQNDPVLHKFPQPRLFEGQKTLRLLEPVAGAVPILVYVTLTYYGNP